MTMKHLWMALLAAGILAAGPANAEVIFSPAFSYETVNEEIAGATTIESAQYFIDARLGYLMPTGLYLGGIYSMISGDIDDDSLSSYYFGPSIGFVNGGFSLIGSYFILGEYERTAELTFIEGKGIQVDVSYAFPLSSSFSLGPQITYKSVNHEKAEQDGNEGDLEFERTTIRPMINLWFVF